MQLKMIVETCSYEVEQDGGLSTEGITEIIAVQEFIIPVVYDQRRGYYVPGDEKQMLRPYVHMIELAVMQNVDYEEIATQCGVLLEFMKRLDAYEPTHEVYLIEILARLLYEVGCNKIVPTTGNVMFRLLYILEEADEV